MGSIQPPRLHGLPLPQCSTREAVDNHHGVQVLGRAPPVPRTVLSRAPFQVPGRALVQALGRAPHPHHSALLLSRFKKSCATASVEATFISTLYDSFIYMFEN